MRNRSKWMFSTLGIAGSLILAGTVQAQYTTNVLTDFHSFNLSVTYANWNVDGSDPLNGGTGFTPIITSGANDYRVQAQGYGSGAYNFSTPVSLSGASLFLFTFTINAPSSVNWMNPGLDISDGTHMVHLTASNAEGGFLDYGNYSGPNTFTRIGPLTDQFGGAALDTSTITAFNLEFDPAGFGAGAPYDITYKSIALLTPIPEPSTLALLGIGAVGFLALRQRATAG